MDQDEINFQQRLRDIQSGTQHTMSIIFYAKKNLLERCKTQPDPEACRHSRAQAFDQIFAEDYARVVECQRQLYFEYYLKSKYHPLYHILRNRCKEMGQDSFYQKSKRTSLFDLSPEENLAAIERSGPF